MPISAKHYSQDASRKECLLWLRRIYTETFEKNVLIYFPSFPLFISFSSIRCSFPFNLSLQSKNFPEWKNSIKKISEIIG